MDVSRMPAGALIVLAAVVSSLLAARKSIHYFQLESYQFRGYWKTLARQWEKAFEPCLLLSAAVLIAAVLLSALSGLITAGGSIWMTLAGLALAGGVFLSAWLAHKKQLKEKEKKPFAMTARVKRLYVTLFLLLCGLSATLWFSFFAGRGSFLFLAVFALIPLGLPLWTALAACLIWPVEMLIQYAYLSDARKKLLANDRLIRIGITGSYGKTSTKFILAEMLSQKYNVLATPASFNTPMGLTGVIRSRLTPAHQVFIAEMGARHPQDIRELCRLVHPTIGVLTSVGPQHLDTFHTLENIRNTKYDLIRALPEDGLAVFADDGDIVTGLFRETSKPRLLTGAENSDAWADDIQVGAEGSRFTLHLKGHEPISCVTPLLCRHNIANIVLAAALAARLGVSDRQLQTAISQLKPVEHRLKIVTSAGGVTVIDDAFNTNPVSSKAALDVLRMYPPRRIIVTPGMVELGAEEARYNREFGEYMADCADIVLLVGAKHTAPIAEGLRAKGFDEESLHVCGSLEEAVATLKTLTRPGDTVMYENDLPDSYTEGE